MRSREDFVNLSDMKKVLRALFRSSTPLSIFQVHEQTGISASNLAFVVDQLANTGLVARESDATIKLEVDRRQLFPTARRILLQPIHNELDTVPDCYSEKRRSRHIASIPNKWLGKKTTRGR